ncbi:nucleotidyl transferase AbiEii/AbiGii toxin family protein [Streptacidiphilus sp. NEAU-YB345]|uniref:Nucleotidyl transferase AbiEii/AbiGii toxin family protein n=1 Tax=Streptacidiphilus fuscans TaxID=2789292 RepID=A0A931BBT4_9ACTN|nr:nucleotidyl transferase AbiEii/AbiGii toxin family protein [Streptacidiphilus fuscans]
MDHYGGAGVTSPWQNFGWRSTNVPQAPLDPEERTRLDLPETLRPVASPRAEQRSVFDPALKQHANAYRAADPSFGDPRLDIAWKAERRKARDLVLSAIAETPWADGLVLRGSVLLRAWFGDVAREPGDLDFVVSPTDRRIDEPRTATMLAGITQAVQEAADASSGSVRFQAADAISEDIWTYDRVPGRRLLLPWTVPGASELPGGAIQLDLVFNENLPIAPELLHIPPSGGDGTGALLQAVTPELSLAWKLMWLLTDTHPQGKDLYDAVLLAEHTTLRYQILREVFLDAEAGDASHPVDSDRIGNLDLGGEWRHFVSEYPALPADENNLVIRLVAATAPTFTAVETPADTAYARHVRWLQPRIERYRLLLAAKGMGAVQERMQKDGLHLRAAIVITCDLLGRDDHGTEHARAVVLADSAWAPWVRIGERNPEWLTQQMHI